MSVDSVEGMRLLGAIGLLLLGLSIVAVLWPPIVVVPFAVVGVWVALALLARAWRFTKEASPRPEQPNG